MKHSEDYTMKFDAAKAIFIKNKRDLMNFQAGFKCTFEADCSKEYTLKITGATLYAIYLNNEFWGMAERQGDMLVWRFFLYP